VNQERLKRNAPATGGTCLLSPMSVQSETIIGHKDCHGEEADVSLLTHLIEQKDPEFLRPSITALCSKGQVAGGLGTSGQSH